MITLWETVARGVNLDLMEDKNKVDIMYAYCNFSE